MKHGEHFSGWVLLNGAKLLLILPLFAFVLVVNGAIPGLLTPGMGIVLWLTGFAQSLANADQWSVFAYDIGLPEPAAIAFGLPGALVTALALRAGLSPPDAYAMACLFWLAVAFWGAYSLCRTFGAPPHYRAFGATIWLTFPIVWQHQGYSMVAIGIALIPTYYFSSLKLLTGAGLPVKDFVLFQFLCITSLFMDGYSFVMFASASMLTAAAMLFDRRLSIDFASRILVLILGFSFSYLLYTQYTPAGDFRASITFFRGWGVDLSFLLAPPKGLLWLPDLIGQSAERHPGQFFGDPSVYRTTFILTAFAAAVISLMSPYGDRKVKLLMFGIGLIALYLALGPSLKFNSFRPEDVHSGLMPAEHAIGPTGTEVLWRHVPGFNSMRAVYRWTALALLGFWGVTMVALADQRLRRWGWVAIAVLIAFNIPYLGASWERSSKVRAAYVQLGTDLEKLAPAFRAGEVVAFLPAGNDFLINDLAPRLGIRTYNIGGDKNAAIAKVSWPDELQPFRKPLSVSDFSLNAEKALASGLIDAVAIPYIDLLRAAHHWPYPRDLYKRAQAVVEEFASSPLTEVTQTEYFALVRLKPEIRSVSKAELTAFLNSCPGKPVTADAVQLIPAAPLRFSRGSAVCSAGWSGAERWGRWTDGTSAELHYVLPELGGTYVLEFDTRGYVAGGLTEQRIGVRVNGKPSTDWVFTRGAPRLLRRLELPRGTRGVDIEFAIPNALSPKEAGRSADPRVLGLGITAVCLTEIGKRCLAK